MDGLCSGSMEAFRVPVRNEEGAASRTQPESGMALCLSGGGYRALLFHLGALRRLNELGYLVRLDHIASVSGGSIVAGLLGLRWSGLDFTTHGVARNFVEAVELPARALVSRTIDVWAVLFGWLGFDLTSQLRRHLFGEATLQSLPDRPRFVINACNMQSGALWRFSKAYARDYRVGCIPTPTIKLAAAVAASAAFPPVLSQVVLRFADDAFEAGTGDDLQRPPFTRRVVLTDGGVYDNLGLETAWKHYQTVLSSDGTLRVQPEGCPSRNWVGLTARVIALIHGQVASVRKRQLVASFLAEPGPDRRAGAYWGIGSNIASYPVAESLPCPEEATLRLASISTRFRGLGTEVQERLVNWGYAICDAAIRSHVDPGLAPPVGFPYPQVGVG